MLGILAKTMRVAIGDILVATVAVGVLVGNSLAQFFRLKIVAIATSTLFSTAVFCSCMAASAIFVLLSRAVAATALWTIEWRVVSNS